MKTALLVSLFFCATVAFGQSSAGAGALNAEPVIIEFNSHAAHASVRAMGHEESLLQSSVNVQAHGTRPLWEVAVPSQAMPLGDYARNWRKEHASAKKAEIVWSN
ncbi:MAG TPA: hypothetical protein VHS34_18205 [Terriglobales bacterium]|jgi:hypothetical protein|nr:hypothetical protein [Terriglobales bacterium]